MYVYFMLSLLYINVSQNYNKFVQKVINYISEIASTSGKLL